MKSIVLLTISIIILQFIPSIFCDGNVRVPPDKSKLNSWFQANVKGLAERKATLDPALVAAEAAPNRIKITSDGKGQFKTINDAIKSIPDGNKNRVIISLGPGIYKEKIKIERTKPFITFIGDPKNPPVMVFDGTAAQFGTVESATMICESDYFNAVNIIFKNSAPRPIGERPGEQAVAVKIGGDKASFYNCRFIGFQDTLCDDKGLHFFKDCYIEGTIDYIFGNGKSIYLNTELHVIPGDNLAIITAQAKHNAQEDTGYSFIHCKVTGTGGTAWLGRAWMPYSTVVFSYTDISDVVRADGWSNDNKPDNEKTVFFGEFRNTGPGSKLDNRVNYTKKLTAKDAAPYLKLGYIQASKWLLPPTTI